MSNSSKLLAPSSASPRRRRRAAAAFVFALVFSSVLFADSPRARAQDAPAESQPSPSQSPAPAINATNTAAAGKTAKGTGGAITGRVLADGEPLAGARVFAVASGSNRGNVEPLAVTDEAGNFRIENLAPGLYTVGTGHRGYVVDAESFTTGQPRFHRPGDDVTIRLVKGGVVTGTVTGADGEPLVAITVRAFYTRDFAGNTAGSGYSFGEDQTDDRGVYRIYGLRPGVYVVATAGEGMRPNWPGTASPYKSETPTYYPSGTRDTASEVTVRVGQETAGIDIRHRGERGRRVTGVIPSAQGAADSVALVTLTHAATGTQVATVFTQPSPNERPFVFDAVADGEYEVQARVSVAGFTQSASAPQRVVVAGNDVTGLRLTLAPLATVSGSLVVEPSAEADRARGECKEQPRAPLLPQETVVVALNDDTSKKTPAARRMTARRDTAPDSSGGFSLRALDAGRYRFDLRFADDNWYFRELQLAPTTPTAATPAAAPARPGAARTPAAAAAAANTAAARETLDLKAGEQLTGLVVRVAENAASLSGRVAPREENAPLPPSPQLRVHLVPAAREQADNPLRFYETTPAADGSFSFKNLAPGRYLVLARGAEVEAGARPAAWDSASRARLRREAEEANAPVELQPCQRQTDFALRFPQAPGK